MEAELEKTRTKLAQATGNPDLNPNSPTQVKKFLYEDLKLPPQIHRVRKAITSDEEAIEKLQVKCPAYRDTLQLLLDYRKVSKLIGTFLDSQLSEDGRMRTQYNITGASTGRISSATTLDGEGGNLQQIPSQEDTGREIRRMYIAGPGKVLIKTDLEQAEARAVAWFARIHSLIKNFNTPGFDVHKWNASLIYEKPVSEITKEERYEAKRCVHGANYKIGAEKVSIINKIPLPRAKMALNKYRSAIPELEIWWREIDQQLQTTRSLRNPFGRLRIFLDRLDETTLRSAIATLPQSLIADIINAALARADHYMHERWGDRARPLMQVHDEIVYEVDEDLVDEVIPFIIQNTEVPIKFPLVDVPLVVPVELKLGPNWLDCVSYEKWKCQKNQKTS
jgi:DNA polymerase-1